MSSNKSASGLGFTVCCLLFTWQVLLLGAWSWILLSAQPQARSLAVPDDSAYEGAPAGQVVDLWRQVPVRANGNDYLVSHGRHFHPDGYYYGQMWQCVEYAKRYYKEALNHEMPDVMGHAADFFDPELPHGQINPARNLIQYINGGDEPPQPDDLIVWAYDQYGHIAVVTQVTDSEVEVIQQNVKNGTRMRLKLTRHQNQFTVGNTQSPPAGWLRKRE